MPPKAKRGASNQPRAKAAVSRVPSNNPSARAATRSAPSSNAGGASKASASSKPLAAPAAEEGKKEACATETVAKDKKEEEVNESATEEAPGQAGDLDKKPTTEVGEKDDDEEEAKRKAREQAELQRLVSLADGEVTIKYNMYAEKFPIAGHALTAQSIDDVYCLSDVMPGCFIHLSEREYGYGEEHVYLKESPVGTFRGLLAGETYWCYVQQDPEQEERDKERMRKLWAEQSHCGGAQDRATESESCSCSFGAPCTNPMICRDWDNRFANAIKAGGNPLLFVV